MHLREGFVDSEGHQLAWLAANEHLTQTDQPAIVFIHGVLASVYFWPAVLPPDIRDGMPWYALSLPAHAPSRVPGDFHADQVTAEGFNHIMESGLNALLGTRKAIIVGHSTGGFSGLNLALHHAPNVTGVISIGGFHSGQWQGLEGLLIKLAGLGRWAKPIFELNIRAARRSRLIQKLFATSLAHRRRVFWRSPATHRMLDAIATHADQIQSAALFELFRGIHRIDIADDLHRIEVRCHIFAGTHDPTIQAAQSLVLAAEIPGARAVALRKVGHMPFMEAPDILWPHLIAALAEHGAGQRKGQQPETG
ncbi:MAG: alpha/beta hydrolase [Gammaproteobacteria bacterium]|nr:MAG: alpha/beta hydrolase [Gammaproteobacteria bacterium]